MQTYSIKELRRLLINEPQFATTMEYFFDWLKEHHVTAFATEAHSKTLEQMVKIGLTKMLNKPIIFKRLEMREVKNLHFLHGAGEMEKNTQVTFFYFKDLDMGMMVCVKLNSNEQTLARFQMAGPAHLDINQNQN